jgi:hypothetical protein
MLLQSSWDHANVAVDISMLTVDTILTGNLVMMGGFIIPEKGKCPFSAAANAISAGNALLVVKLAELFIPCDGPDLTC